MKIVITARARDEERDMARFLRCYQWADKILIADGGSEDRTVEIATSFPKTEVRLFAEREYKDGQWHNPVMPMINFLLTWAEEEERPDWIIFDDIDCVPNVDLQEQAREIFIRCRKNFVNSNRVYVFGVNQYFEGLSMQKEGWMGGLWAWRGGIGMRADMENKSIHQTFNLKFDDAYNIEHPACRLHYFCPDPETIEKKLSHYRVFDNPATQHPLKFGGRLLPLLPYMRDM